MGMRMIAGVVKTPGAMTVRAGGDPNYAAAMAAAAVSQDVARLRSANYDLQRKLSYYKKLYYAKKMDELQQSMERARKSQAAWYVPFQLAGACIYLAVTKFVGLLIVKEE